MVGPVLRGGEWASWISHSSLVRRPDITSPPLLSPHRLFQSKFLVALATCQDKDHHRSQHHVSLRDKRNHGGFLATLSHTQGLGLGAVGDSRTVWPAPPSRGPKLEWHEFPLSNSGRINCPPAFPFTCPHPFPQGTWRREKHRPINPASRCPAMNHVAKQEASSCRCALCASAS